MVQAKIPIGKRVHEYMQDLIGNKMPVIITAKAVLTSLSTEQYVVTHLRLSRADAEQLQRTYYQQYGLALEGLVRHHKIDPLEYNRLVDDALPLEDVLKPDPQLRALLLDFDRSKVRLWLFTNAYVNHARRVVRLLGVDDLFEGMTYCDYGAERLVCKPHEEMFAKAQKEVGVSSPEQCYFVGAFRLINLYPPMTHSSIYLTLSLFPSSDDSYLNCKKAHELGWTAVHLLEQSDAEPKMPASKYQIRSLEELRQLFPQFFLHGGSVPN